jgi:two-component system, chemotaxis family, chemotaxis protein CheY
MKIMIVDDSSFMRKSLEYIVTQEGHTVVDMADNGVSAVERYKKIRPDLITLDILMKGGDGLTALEAIRKFDPLAKVVMITAMGHEDKQELARKLGASGYIRKPFDPKEIKAVLKKAFDEK